VIGRSRQQVDAPLAIGVLLVAMTVAAATSAYGSELAPPQARSAYLALGSDRTVTDRTILLTARVRLSRADSVFVATDGSYAPASAATAAKVFIEIDGRRVTNESSTDWRVTPNPWAVPVRHSFNAVGATRLGKGSHVVELVGEAVSGEFTAAAGSNLSVFVHPAERVAVGQLDHEEGPFGFTTRGRSPSNPPHTAVVSVRVSPNIPAVAVGSASLRGATSDESSWGDPMASIYADGRHPGNGSSLWAVQEIGSNELEAPVFTHALFRTNKPHAVVSLDATEFPWFDAGGPLENPIEDGARYLVRPTAALVVLSGGLGVFGGAPALAAGHTDSNGTSLDYYCLASSSGFPGCEPIGSATLLAQASFRVPTKHPGVVFFTAKTRVQGDNADPGGLVSVWLTIDGVRRGSSGVQEIAAPSGVSQRTVTASYLSTGTNALKPGRHTVRVYGRADGQFVHISLVRDIPLIWFD
jgi:hypothetical protein